ncbi:DUF4062 domain-containing protein [Pseudoglutamicibacter cumminsii]|uniref:DUF4062 domain-containing protein n=1 Tax=Pseudoglutamicibacter cumminsii TaxID=156979 RepID=UPI002552F723|nr:DUF4062 domain-containing protein [Pseudoglutamicibacter cumminsii]MDK7083166.1 DUF4062 domain-containing protein [Pseudoglutamicibacter cumminsii]
MPLLGGHPQEIINAQGVDGADIVVALFGSRLGSPTPDAVSGTVEEIERAVSSGKPVHLYFSRAPLSHDVDTAQLEGLRNFKNEIKERGLLGEFDDIRQLENQIWSAIEQDLTKIDLSITEVLHAPTGVRFRVDSKSEQHQKETDKRGRIKYKTNRWLEVTNIGDEAAESVKFEADASSGGMFIATNDEPITLEPGSVWKIPVAYSMGTSGQTLTISWLEHDEEQSKTFNVQ